MKRNVVQWLRRSAVVAVVLGVSATACWAQFFEQVVAPAIGVSSDGSLGDDPYNNWTYNIVQNTSVGFYSETASGKATNYSGTWQSYLNYFGPYSVYTATIPTSNDPPTSFAAWVATYFSQAQAETFVKNVKKLKKVSKKK